MDIALPYLMQDVDRHGNVRLHVRKKIGGKFKYVRLRQPPGSPTFMAEYQAALERLSEPSKQPAGQIQVGTLGWLAREYQQSPQFTKTDPRQQRMRMLVVRSTLAETTKPGSKLRFEDCPLAKFTADHVRVLRNRKQDTPSAGNRRVAELRKMLDWGMEERSAWVKHNVAADVKPLQYEKEGFKAWEHEEVAKFEAHFPIGTMPRLALALMLYTGVRRSDACRLGPPMVKDGSITFVPVKTRRMKKVLVLPLLPILQNVINQSPTGLKTFVVSSKGTPFEAASFGNWFRRCCDEAGLPDCSAHGLRKIAAETMAENGATEKEMMDTFGWTKADLAAYYARKANQKKIAGNAMHKMIPNAS